MASDYIDLAIEVDTDALVQRAITDLMALLPGWTPREGHLEVRLLEAAARLASVQALVASRVPSAIFRTFGTNLAGVPPIAAAKATVASTWVMIDDAGYTVPAGTVVAFQTAGDTWVPFITLDDVVVSPGQTTTAAGSVSLEAVDPGSDANGYTGAMVLIDAIAAVSTITATTTSSGGVDAETDAVYMARLASELELLTPRPILAEDYAVLARRVTGVGRALGIDNYNPGDDTDNNERMVTVALVDDDGVAVGGGVKTVVEEYLEAFREINFVVNTMDPTFTTITVVSAIKVLPGYTSSDVCDACETAILAYLSPANWAGGDEDPPVWRSGYTTVRYLELATLINNVDGVDYISTLTVNGGTANVTLTGKAPLPKNDSTATVTAI